MYDFWHFETLGRGRVSSQADPSAFADTKTLPDQHQLVQIAKQIFEESDFEEQILQYFWIFQCHTMWRDVFWQLGWNVVSRRATWGEGKLICFAQSFHLKHQNLQKEQLENWIQKWQFLEALKWGAMQGDQIDNFYQVTAWLRDSSIKIASQLWNCFRLLLSVKESKRLK